MFKLILNLFGKAKKPANNVYTLEAVRAAHFFNAAARAVRAQELRGRYKDRAINHARIVWGKHRDRVQGYEMPADAERQMLAYIDLQSTYQRTERPTPSHPWSGSAA